MIDTETLRAARDLLPDAVTQTPLVAAHRISQLLGCEVFFKLETMQPTGSFKDRGAFVKLSRLTDDQKNRGVVAMSAGNHAQGVAFHARAMGIPATIIMPVAAPVTKIERTKALGAEVILGGETLDEAKATVDQLIAERGLTLVHPFDDEDIVAGQASIGFEIMEQCPDADCIIAPIGGGGILSGTGLAAKSVNPGIQICGVEAVRYPSMHQALGRTDAKSGGNTLADGIAVKAPGGITKAIVEQIADELFLVDEDAIEQAIFLLAQQANLIAEGAGASGLAALIRNQEQFAGKKVVIVLCGGNIDTRLLISVLQRGMESTQQLVRLRVLIDDRPGALSTVSQIIGSNRGNIVDVAHRRDCPELMVKFAYLDFVIEVPQPATTQLMINELAAAGFEAVRRTVHGNW